MNTLEAVYSRRSIRKYRDRPVPAEMIEEMLRAAMFAPSARNFRSWQFIVVDERKKLDDLSEIHPYAKMLKQASLALLVCGDISIEPEDGYNAINCSAATQNILLAAHELGLGTCWLGLFPRKPRMDDVSKYFNLPEHIMPVNLIAVGWPAEQKSRPDRFEKEKIHLNEW